MWRSATALMMASRSGNLEAVKALLDHGAQVNAKENLRGTTAIMWAAEQGHCVRMFGIDALQPHAQWQVKLDPVAHMPWAPNRRESQRVDVCV